MLRRFLNTIQKHSRANFSIATFLSRHQPVVILQNHENMYENELIEIEEGKR